MFSAIKQGGRSVHKRARRGETVVLAPRPVELRSLAIGATGRHRADLTHGRQGYYVRSLARDLGETGGPSHLASLRRTASGPFTLDEALPLDAPVRSSRGTAAGCPRRAPGAPCRRARRARRALREARPTARASGLLVPPPVRNLGLVRGDGGLVAIGRAASVAGFAVHRGFLRPPRAPTSEDLEHRAAWRMRSFHSARSAPGGSSTRHRARPDRSEW